MDKITYAGESFLTGSAIAHALLDYAQALAQTASSAMVPIPTVDGAGQRVRSEILLGPASQILSTTVSSEVAEVEDADLVARLSEAANRLRLDGPAAPRPQLEDAAAEEWPEYEF
mgnify:CR=1 FL=1